MGWQISLPPRSPIRSKIYWTPTPFRRENKPKFPKAHEDFFHTNCGFSRGFYSGITRQLGRKWHGIFRVIIKLFTAHSFFPSPRYKLLTARAQKKPGNSFYVRALYERRKKRGRFLRRRRKLQPTFLKSGKLSGWKPRMMGKMTVQKWTRDDSSVRDFSDHSATEKNKLSWRHYWSLVILEREETYFVVTFSRI